jgi:hypothetical protein
MIWCPLDTPSCIYRFVYRSCMHPCTRTSAASHRHTYVRLHLHQQCTHAPTHAWRRACTSCGSCAMCLAGPQGVQGEDGRVPEGGEEIGGLVCRYQPFQARAALHISSTFEHMCGMCRRNCATLTCTHHPDQIQLWLLQCCTRSCVHVHAAPGEACRHSPPPPRIALRRVILNASQALGSSTTQCGIA